MGLFARARQSGARRPATRRRPKRRNVVQNGAAVARPQGVNAPRSTLRGVRARARMLHRPWAGGGGALRAQGGGSGGDRGSGAEVWGRGAGAPPTLAANAPPARTPARPLAAAIAPLHTNRAQPRHQHLASYDTPAALSSLFRIGEGHARRFLGCSALGDVVGRSPSEPHSGTISRSPSKPFQAMRGEPDRG